MLPGTQQLGHAGDHHDAAPDAQQTAADPGGKPYYRQPQSFRHPECPSQTIRATERRRADGAAEHNGDPGIKKVDTRRAPFRRCSR